MAYLPGVQYKTGTTELGGGGTDPNVLKEPGSAQAYGVPQPTVYNGGITADNGTALADEAATANFIKTSVTRPAQDLSYIDNYMAALEKRRAESEKSINESFDVARGGLSEQQRRETGSTSAGIARAGGYLGFSGSAQGVLINLGEQHKAEMQGLEAKRQAALNEARVAYEDKQFAAAKMRVEEVRQYEQESYERQQKYFETLKTETEKIKKDEADQLIYAQIFDEFQNGAQTELDIFERLKGKASPEQISTFFTKLKPKTVSGDTFTLSNQNMAHLLGSGMGKDDVQALSDYINTNGYTDELKATLTPYQRRVVDSIFTQKPIATKAFNVDFIPSTLKEFASVHGPLGVYEGLLNPDNKPPEWFKPIIDDVMKGVKIPLTLPLDETYENIADSIWKDFKAQPEIQTFIQQINRKLLGSVDGAGPGFFDNSPPPVAAE